MDMLLAHRGKRPALRGPAHHSVAMMSRRLGCLLVALCVTIPSLAFAADNPVLRRFNSGAGNDAVGMIDASEDTEVAGPQAIYAGDGNEVFLLDQVNGRVLSFDPKKPAAQTRSFKLPDQLEPTDLVVKKGEIFVWDGDVHALKPTGADDAPTRGLEEYQTRGIDDPFTVSAFSQMGSQRPGDDSDLLNENTRSLSQQQPRAPAKQYVNSRGRGPVVVNVVTDKDKSGALVEVQAQGQTGLLAKLQVKVRDRLGALEFLDIDKQGRMFLLGENIPAAGGDRASAFVARFSAPGKLEGIYELPLSQSVALSRRFVTVSETGDVYFLRTRQASVDVLGVGFRPLRAKIIETQTQAPVYDSPGLKGKGPIAATLPLSRQRVIETAFAFEGIRWRPSQSTYGRDPDTTCTGFNRIRRPGYLHGKLGQEVRGIPYCWGCHGSLQQIRAQFDRGVLAGNVCTRNAPRTDVAGVDCSAFVSAAWGLATHFTTAAIPAISRRLDDPWDLQPGDALNKPGSHVMLFLRFTPDRKAEVMEASPGACNGRVCRNVYPLASILAHGYAPVRYRALANEAVAKVSFPAEGQEKAQVKPAKGQAKTQKRQTQ
jgi:hypothetical protein